ncbi:peptide ABC transporter substrate-binding protein [Bombilactobacillus folatiphilus]|uniref:Peptide ABC transporter substrate-binding protein n=1 Tax=Bombilactobacillus folatiphilus TaxID=2923362 RepID=A0ABY4PA60_9LACO|nr:peptide ABC transporter substrate-binding protein [Bombilactobacillus folatiphilus]UQS82633.1 peptide ABC transporter substrate-binding protein [Bombilactobacillus folatiphilus]
MKTKLWFLLGTLALLLTGCQSKNNSGSAQQLNLMQTSDLLSLDTSQHADLPTWNTLENSMEGLYRADKHNQPQAAMATKVVQPTNQGKTYTFSLRKNAKWSNGEPVVAQDFVTAWRRSVSSKAQSGYNYIFSGIQNADAISKGQKAPRKLGVKALDKHTLQVQLEHPMPYFNKMMVMPAFFPQNRTALKKFKSHYGTQSKYLYYNGPFKVTKWTGDNDSWVLMRNKYYYDKKQIHLNKIKYLVVKDANTAHELFSQNKLDDATITGVTAKELQGSKNLIHEKKAGNYYLRVNVRNNQPLANAKMRQAINLAIDRQALTKNILADGSLPASTYTAKDLSIDPTTKKDFAQETTPQQTYNVKQARTLWDEGRQEANLPKKLTLKVLGDDQTITKNVAEFLQDELQHNLPGVKVQIRNVPDKTASSETRSGQFNLSQTLWLADFADPISFMGILNSDNPQNYGKYHDDQFDQLYQKAILDSSNNQQAYWQTLRQMQARLNESMPVIPLYQMVESHLVNPKLQGVLRHPVGEDDYTRAYLK